MKVIKPYAEILTSIDEEKIMRNIETAGRTCYKSDSVFTLESGRRFVKGLISSGHESVLEHEVISVCFVCDRGVSHELVRHRIASFSQESTRYCNYAKANEIIFIKPFFWEKGTQEYFVWESLCQAAENSYLSLINSGSTPQKARTVLPNSLKTELVMTANLREWRLFFKLRALGLTGKPHPQMLELTVPLLSEFAECLPAVFGDLLGQLKDDNNSSISDLKYFEFYKERGMLPNFVVIKSSYAENERND